jgi:hypothetical protein
MAAEARLSVPKLLGIENSDEGEFCRRVICFVAFFRQNGRDFGQGSR